jgi:propanol-preferring alcohol dehydrogenase
MRAIILESESDGHLPRALNLRDVPKPEPGPGQLLVRVNACAVCRTDLHIVHGELSEPKLPLILGHQIVGRVEGPSRTRDFKIGDRVGIPWLGWTDGDCGYCRTKRENLCDRARFTGYNIDGGYAEFTVADPRYCFHLPNEYGDIEVAPLLCAGLIGYRAYRKTGNARRLGLYGFGNAAHLIAQVAIHEDREIFAFTRPGDVAGQESARSLGAIWAGGSDELPPEKLDAAIIFASAGEIPAFPYHDLWNERVITSVANLTRRDGEEFFEIASRSRIKTKTEIFPLEEANAAIDRFRSGRLDGTAVLRIS